MAYIFVHMAYIFVHMALIFVHMALTSFPMEHVTLLTIRRLTSTSLPNRATTNHHPEHKHMNRYQGTVILIIMEGHETAFNGV